jgi:hypothetical protein
MERMLLLLPFCYTTHFILTKLRITNLLQITGTHQSNWLNIQALATLFGFKNHPFYLFLLTSAVTVCLLLAVT